jgi:hypothetical protein
MTIHKTRGDIIGTCWNINNPVFLILNTSRIHGLVRNLYRIGTIEGVFNIRARGMGLLGNRDM